MNLWDAAVEIDGSDHVFTGVAWNGTLDPGASATFGFCADL